MTKVGGNLMTFNAMIVPVAVNFVPVLWTTCGLSSGAWWATY